MPEFEISYEVGMLIANYKPRILDLKA